MSHETILVRPARIIDPYVVAHGLGMTFRARAALRFEGSEAEADLMVRRRESPDQDWETAPPPSLLVEVLSFSTRLRDRKEKRDFYLNAGVAEYWIVDPETKTITTIRRGEPDARLFPRPASVRRPRVPAGVGRRRRIGAAHEDSIDDRPLGIPH